jgi:histidinol-phosphate phosphatase family protein
MPPNKRPGVFFDRDGIVNHPPPPGEYVERPADFHIQESFIDALAVVQRKGLPSVIITNQQGIGKGRYTEADVRTMHRMLEAELRKRALKVPGLFFCPHLAAAQCACRKPKPGMLLEAAEKYQLNLVRSWMVGDHESDVQAAHAAGCRAIRVHPTDPTAAEQQVASMRELPALLERLL